MQAGRRGEAFARATGTPSCETPCASIASACFSESASRW
jgi:hypothetical protein